jgi:hypothetical protein
MSRLVLLPLTLALLVAALAEGQNPPPRPPDAVRFQQLQRNRALIQLLVQGGLRLAAENDPVRRAAYCSGMARRLADEVEQAARDQETDRAVELGSHLERLLQAGVAGSLGVARRRIPPGSAEETELRRVARRVADLTRPLEDLLNSMDDNDAGDLRQVLHQVHDARRQVDRSIKPPATP